MKIRRIVENENSWERLKAVVVAGKAGTLIRPFDEIDLVLNSGETITVVAAAYLAAAEDKPAGLRFVIKDCLAELHLINKTWTNQGGYRNSEIRRYILQDVLPLFPDDLRSVIRPRKITEITEGKPMAYEDILWLPSETEVFGRNYESMQNGIVDGSDDFQMPIFMTERDRVKGRARGGTVPWALRSVFADSAYVFCLVNANGGAIYGSARLSWGVAPGFDI